MRLSDLIAAVARSHASDWVRLDGYAHLEHLSVNSDSRLEVEVTGRHHSRAFLRDDLDMSLQWGADTDRGEPHPPVEPDFTRSFSDHVFYREIAEVCWRGQPVVRRDYLLVDGSRACLPYPDPLIVGDPVEGPSGAGAAGWKVKQSEVVFARLLDRLEGHTQFDDYMRRAGFEVV